MAHSGLCNAVIHGRASKVIHCLSWIAQVMSSMSVETCDVVHVTSLDILKGALSKATQPCNHVAIDLGYVSHCFTSASVRAKRQVRPRASQ